MKPLNELIDAVKNAAEEEIISLRYCGTATAPSEMAMYRKGHRACFDLLAPALKEAIKDLEAIIAPGQQCLLDCWCDVCIASNSIEKIRAILGGRGE